MKNFLISFTALLYITAAAKAQVVVLNLTFHNSTATSCHIWLPQISFFGDYLKKGSFDIPLAANKPASRTFVLSGPQYAYLTYSSSDADSAKTYTYVLYLSPGDHLNFSADLKRKGNGIVVTGQGSNNNQPLLSALAGKSMQEMNGDTVPNRIIKFVKNHQNDLTEALSQYIKLYKPSSDFIKNEQINITYTAVFEYFDFKENNKYSIRQAFLRNENKWNAIQDSLFNTVKLNNNEALNAINYTFFIKTFMLREKERLWSDSYKNPQLFFKKWYDADVETGKRLMDDDLQNVLQEKIINMYFTDKPAEYLYATLLDDALHESNPQNLVPIFNRFKQKYPESEYVKWFTPAIDSVRTKEEQPLTTEMVFVPDNGTKLNNFDDLLKLIKGKTVLLDMWGTWCGPCRNEIHDNGPAIKAYFKGKGLDYLYVANRDLNHADEWKKLIAYFDMKGTHILANADLSKDIMAKVKGQGYPTYVIIKKDGSFELSKAGYPMNRNVLFKQLEDALKW